MDFEGVAIASISYVKETLLYFVALGRWHAQALSFVEVDWMNEKKAEPRDVYTFALNANPEVADSMDHAFARQGWPVLAGTSVIRDQSNRLDAPSAQDLERLTGATLLGQIDTATAATLDAIVGLSQCTALELHQRFARSQNIGATGWNNRLADLYRARLSRRTRRGKFWIYHPLATSVTKLGVTTPYGQTVS